MVQVQRYSGTVVQWYRWRRAAGGTATAAPPPPPAEPPPDPEPEDNAPVRNSRGGARVGVLPMQVVGGTASDAHLGPGLAEEISTALARFRWMFVVASTSLARHVAEQGSDAGIRRAFGVDFLVDGTIQRGGDRIRINVKLLDLRANNHIVWARRFDREASDLLSLQDEIAAEVVAQIDPEILLIEARHTAAHPPVDATAYDLLLRAIPLMSRMDREPYLQAGDYLAQAIALEPDYAAAHAWYAYWHIFLVGQAWADDPPAVMRRASELAERAIILDPYDARALTIAGHVRAFLHRQPREAAALH